MRVADFYAEAHWAYREGGILGTPAAKVELVLWVPVKPSGRMDPLGVVADPG